MVTFSVVMATRNRPVQFKRALESVNEQSYPDIEIVVVADGCSNEDAPGYRAIAEAVGGGRVRWLSLPTRPNGHGQSYAFNVGAAQATGTYLCFLDDDDWWTDKDHLKRAKAVIDSADDKVDLYLSNQVAFLHDVQKTGPIWIEDLEGILQSRAKRSDWNGAYRVSVDELLLGHGFCHLNTLIVRHALYDEVGGMDEAIRWECDRDLYLRLIDQASAIEYMPVAVARHNIPDPTKAANMTTTLSEFERRLFQIRVLDRAATLSQHAAIRAYGRQHKAYALKKLAEHVHRLGWHAEAAFYAREALAVGPTIKWAGYTAWLLAKALVGSSIRPAVQGTMNRRGRTIASAARGR